MRERLGHADLARLAWSLAAGVAVALTAIGLDASRLTGLVAGAAACVSIFLALRLYADGASV